MIMNFRTNKTKTLHSKFSLSKTNLKLINPPILLLTKILNHRQNITKNVNKLIESSSPFLNNLNRQLSYIFTHRTDHPKDLLMPHYKKKKKT